MKILHCNMFLCLDKATQPSVCQRLRVKSCHLKLEVCEKLQHKWSVAVFSDRAGPVPAVLQKRTDKEER